jgi:hypothetical protein
MTLHTNPTKEPCVCVSPYSITGIITDRFCKLCKRYAVVGLPTPISFYMTSDDEASDKSLHVVHEKSAENMLSFSGNILQEDGK